MQIVFLPQEITIALCFIIWPIIQVLLATSVRAMPKSFFTPNNLIFRCYKFEQNGMIYEKYFKIKLWKKYLPDGSAITGIGLKKKRLNNYSKETLNYYLCESCRAELIHLLAIPPFILFGLFCPPEVILYMFIYAVVINFPCAITQRYNRPRVLKLLDKINY